jgi:hypothetical protein
VRSGGRRILRQRMSSLREKGLAARASAVENR